MSPPFHQEARRIKHIRLDRHHLCQPAPQPEPLVARFETAQNAHFGAERAWVPSLLMLDQTCSPGRPALPTCRSPHRIRSSDRAVAAGSPGATAATPEYEECVARLVGEAPDDVDFLSNVLKHSPDLSIGASCKFGDARLRRDVVGIMCFLRHAGGTDDHHRNPGQVFSATTRRFSTSFQRRRGEIGRACPDPNFSNPSDVCDRVHLVPGGHVHGIHFPIGQLHAITLARKDGPPRRLTA